MAAIHAEKKNKEANSKHILSSYAEKLEGIDKRRYIDKISVIGMDPLEIPLQKFATELAFLPWKLVIFSYILCWRQVSTQKSSSKIFKILLSYNHIVSGFIFSVLGQVIQEKYVVIIIAKVRLCQK